MTIFNVSSDTTYCFSEKNFAEKHLTAWQTDALITLNLMFCLGNFCVNLLVIVLLVKTNQLSNYSYRFLLLLTFSDVCIAIFTQPFQTVVISDVLLLYIPCSVISLINILSNTFLHISIYHWAYRIWPLWSNAIPFEIQENINFVSSFHFDNSNLYTGSI